ncbi:MFS transporter [Paracoccus xiamenensis]|uniref:MFS transporter n=1 Tax=Paracoccus xiamenensis TaxID=2714901 RepID=UPI00140D35FE|nr:MFS transporter [Paracoccus xiamenensis]NHF72034.1 MFS transporter [Paracoccus xiamenensis]
MMSIFGDGRTVIWRLTVAQALVGAHSTTIFATGAVLGAKLAPQPALATLPVSVMMAGMAGSTLPAGVLAERFGRRAAFMVGAMLGILSGLLGAYAIMVQSFALFCMATLLAGAFAAIGMTFRFVAAECVPANAKPRALATVLAGGVASGLLGGELATATMNAVPAHQFAGSYLAASATALAAGVMLLGVGGKGAASTERGQGRTITQIMGQPLFLVAVTTGAIIYLLMNFLMTSAPLAMRMHGLAQHHANTAVQWHVVAMFAPSFVVGWLISRFGARWITASGLVITGLAAIIGLAGETHMHFLLCLIVLGIGWNFGFAGSSSMILDTHRPEERARAQSANDFIVFGTVMIGSFLSGGVLTTYGWYVVCWLTFPPLVIALAALALFQQAPAPQRVRV